MNYTGLYTPFKLNRPLSEDDIKYQLRQDFSGMDTADSLALDDTIVIKMNSTYLELVDKYYSDRGMPDLFVFIMSLIPFTVAVCVIIFLVIDIFSHSASLTMILLSVFMFIPVSMAMAIYAFIFLRKSWFTWTHYPVRFNRKTRMVHVFKVDGTILSVPWRDVFFTRGCSGPGAMPEWSIDGHILADDGI
ncbi:DUF6708 domain-containing protein, partial [Erwinia sorbitola]|nr:hypothetical protein [Erwinia sorbitola]